MKTPEHFFKSAYEMIISMRISAKNEFTFHGPITSH